MVSNSYLAANLNLFAMVDNISMVDSYQILFSYCIIFCYLRGTSDLGWLFYPKWSKVALGMHDCLDFDWASCGDLGVSTSGFAFFLVMHLSHGSTRSSSMWPHLTVKLSKK